VRRRRPSAPSARSSAATRQGGLATKRRDRLRRARGAPKEIRLDDWRSLLPHSDVEAPPVAASSRTSRGQGNSCLSLIHCPSVRFPSTTAAGGRSSPAACGYVFESIFNG
jgi:hypothetical protein